jgi:hypothetical protein
MRRLVVVPPIQQEALGKLENHGNLIFNKWRQFTFLSKKLFFYVCVPLRRNSIIPPKNWYVPLFGINLHRPITLAVRALLTLVLNLIFINDVNNVIHTLACMNVHNQILFYFFFHTVFPS